MVVRILGTDEKKVRFLPGAPRILAIIHVVYNAESYVGNIRKARVA